MALSCVTSRDVFDDRPLFLSVRDATGAEGAPVTDTAPSQSANVYHGVERPGCSTQHIPAQ